MTFEQWWVSKFGHPPTSGQGEMFDACREAWHESKSAAYFPPSQVNERKSLSEKEVEDIKKELKSLNQEFIDLGDEHSRIFREKPDGGYERSEEITKRQKAIFDRITNIGLEI